MMFHGASEKIGPKSYIIIMRLGSNNLANTVRPRGEYFQTLAGQGVGSLGDWGWAPFLILLKTKICV